ncbi:MAG: ribonuclease domain-containing protein [Nocardioides sp.]
MFHQVHPRRRAPGIPAALLLVPLVMILGWWWWAHLGPPSEHEHADSAATATAVGSRDPDSGLRLVPVTALPAEAVETILVIRNGGQFPYAADDGVFGNFEALLPAKPRGYYREYTVATPGIDGRGARRIVVGEGGEYYWTTDHYASFSRIDDP